MSVAVEPTSYLRKLINWSSDMRVYKCIRGKWLFAAITVIALLYLSIVNYYGTILGSWSPLKRFKLARNGCETNLDSESIGSNPTIKKILLWNPTPGNKAFYFGNDELFRNCPSVGRNCLATHNRSHANVEDFDAILFLGNYLKVEDVPSKRRERQKYIYVNRESPINRRFLHSPFDKDFFNLTMTYEHDSDFVWPYGFVRKLLDGSIVAPSVQTVWDTRPAEASVLKNTNPRAIRSMWDESKMSKARRNKTKTAVWLVSNCKPQSGRDKYVNELSKHVDVDIFGKCGRKTKCPRNANCFREVIELDYYFYLSFENSMCQDYVTEKLYNALMFNIVPVVYGGANYSLFAPPRSYINALDFDSPKQLAIYLKSLIAHPSEYDKYFEWKKSYEATRWIGRVFCQLCQYLQENNSTHSYATILTRNNSLHKKCPLQIKLIKSAYLTRKDLKN